MKTRILLTFLILAAAAWATDYTVTTYVPQKEDSPLQRELRQAAALGQMATTGLPVTSGTITLSGTQSTSTPQVLTSGTTSYTAGLYRFDFSVTSGTAQWITTTGTATYTAGQGYGAGIYPNTYPAMSLVVTATSQVLVNSIR